MEQLKFKVKISFFLAAALILLAGRLHIFLFYLISVLIHELAHYFVATKYYYRCDRIELSAFGLTLYGDFEEAVKKDQIVIALAGPLTNLALSLVLLASWYIYPALYVYTEEFLYANLSIGLINLLPCYPLDGGKVLLGVLTKKLTYVQSIKIVKTASGALSILLFFVFATSLFFAEYPFYTVGYFAVLLFSSLIENSDKKIYSRINKIFSRKKRLKYGLEKKRLVFPLDATLGAALSRLETGCVYTFEIVDDNMRTRRVFDEETFYSLLAANNISTKFSEINLKLP